MAKTFKRDKFCDFKIIVGRTTFPVHRLVLDSHSEYFRAMFENDMQESNQGFCEMAGVTEEGVKQCIDFVYGDNLKIHMGNVSDVIQVSHLWQLDEATEKSIEFLKSNLGLHSCIFTKKIAKLYDFEELETDCDHYIIHNLSSITNDNDIAYLTINDIIKITSQGEQLDAESLWEFCSSWAAKQTDKNCSVCDMFFTFPTSRLTTDHFKSTVWNNVHVTSCDNCKSNLSSTFLEKLDCNLDESSPFDIHNCLFVKELVTQYPLHNIKQLVDRFILNKIGEVIKQDGFLEISTDDFLNYMSAIDVDMKKDGFPWIVNWIRVKEERYAAFPKIVLMTSTQSQNKWNISLKDCFFVKSMAIKFDCKEVEKSVDEFMVANFAQIANENGFLSLEVGAFKSYLSSEEVNRFDDKIIWDALNRWINADPSNRQNLFPDLFDSLILEKFSNDFMRNIISKDKRTKEHALFTTKLMDLLFVKVDANETKIQNQSREIKALQQALGDLQNLFQEMKTHPAKLNADISMPQTQDQSIAINSLNYSRQNSGVKMQFEKVLVPRSLFNSDTGIQTASIVPGNASVNVKKRFRRGCSRVDQKKNW